MKSSKSPVWSKLVFLAILSVAAFLRFYKLEIRMVFIGDQGRDFLAAKEMIVTGQVPLLGIASSISRFRQGPVNVWLTAWVFKWFGFDPVNVGLLAASSGLVAVGLVYIVGRWWLTEGAALVASLMLATSPLAVLTSQMPFYGAYIPLVSLAYFGVLIRGLQAKKPNWFWPAFWWGVLFQFELATLPLVVLIPLVFYLRREKLGWLTAVKAGVGLVVGLGPHIIYLFSQPFSWGDSLVAWFFYRLVALFTSGGEDGFSSERLGGVTASIVEQGSKFFGGNLFVSILVLLLLGSGLIAFWQKRHELIKHYKPMVVIGLGITVLLTAFYWHGALLEAYFPALFVPIVWWLGWTWFQLPKLVKKPLAVGLTGLAVYQAIFFFTSGGLTEAATSRTLSVVHVPRLGEQRLIVGLVEAKVADKGVRLRSYGPGSEFASNMDNYRFLLGQRGITESEKGREVWFLRGAQAQEVFLVDSTSYFFDGVTVAIPLDAYRNSVDSQFGR